MGSRWSSIQLQLLLGLHMRLVLNLAALAVQGAVLKTSDRGGLRIQYSKNPFGKKRDHAGNPVDPQTLPALGNVQCSLTRGIPLPTPRWHQQLLHTHVIAHQVGQWP